MGKSFLLFGHKEPVMAKVVGQFEEQLAVKFAEHDSSYKGGAYFRADFSNDENIIVQGNLELDEELAEDDFPDYPLLIYINGTLRPDYWKTVFMDSELGIALLRQEEFKQKLS